MEGEGGSRGALIPIPIPIPVLNPMGKPTRPPHPRVCRSLLGKRFPGKGAGSHPGWDCHPHTPIPPGRGSDPNGNSPRPRPPPSRSFPAGKPLAEDPEGTSRNPSTELGKATGKGGKRSRFSGAALRQFPGNAMLRQPPGWPGSLSRENPGGNRNSSPGHHPQGMWEQEFQPWNCGGIFRLPC